MRIDKYIPRAGVLVFLLTETLCAQAQQENMDTILDVHHILGYLVAAFLISIFVMVFYNRLIYYREKDVIKESERLIAQLSLIMDANMTEAWAYDIEKDQVKLLSSKDTTETVYAPLDFALLYDHDDFSELRKAIMRIKDGESISETLIVRGAAPKSEGGQQLIFEESLSILRSNRHGQPTVLMCTQRDITSEQTRTENTKKLMLRYQTVFESSLVDMVFYDANGILTDVNEKALETFHVTSRQELLDQKVHFNDIPAYRHFDLNTLEPIHFSSMTDISKAKQTDERVPAIRLRGMMYYEASLSPIHDKNGKLLGIIVAGRDITDMVESNHQQEAASQLLEKRTKDIQDYVQNINYSLRVSQVNMVNYYPDKHELEIMNDLNRIQYRLPQLRATALLHAADRHKARGLFYRMDRRRPGNFSETLRTIMHDKDGRDIYLNFRMMPILNKDGQVTHYFGMCRNETEMTYIEQHLQEETAKAQEAEQLKNTFLLNMSYELRTPLNAVIGFAELYGAEHSEEDEPVFAEEIKKNTNTLLKLINDILFISRLDAQMIEYNYQESDFALLFEGWCYMGWSGISPDVKTVIENPYNSLIVNIDQQNLGMVIQKLCIYSGLSTQKGFVRAKYEYRHGELMITIEDSSQGMDGDTLRKAFDRFAHEEGSENEGTGLDLPIVKELIEQMHGTIELQSEPGKGNSFLVSIPCEMSSLEKKAEIIV